MHRHALALFASLALLACTQSHGSGDGVCCPVTDFTGCSPGATPLPGGGWAASLEECSYTISGWDGRPFARVTDEHGCARVQEDTSAPWCGVVFVDAGGPIDAGPPPPPPLDAGPPPPVDAGRDAMTTGCDGLGPAACLTAGCMPTFDDSCCPSCLPGGPCADCVHYVYEGCALGSAACSGGTCGLAPFCGAGPNCASAHVSSEDACDVPGCVPAYPSGEGDPDPSAATCVPIHRDVCRVACRRIAPPCPARTVPEGDGFCYTDRCIPAFVCE